MRYLMITFVRKPDGQIDEQCTVANRVKNSDQAMCNIILDYKEQRVQKCVVEGKALDTDWDRINSYYRTVYPTLIDELEQANKPADQQAGSADPA